MWVLMNSFQDVSRFGYMKPSSNTKDFCFTEVSSFVSEKMLEYYKYSQ